MTQLKFLQISIFDFRETDCERLVVAIGASFLELLVPLLGLLRDLVRGGDTVPSDRLYQAPSLEGGLPKLLIQQIVQVREVNWKQIYNLYFSYCL